MTTFFQSSSTYAPHQICSVFPSFCFMSAISLADDCGIHYWPLYILLPTCFARYQLEVSGLDT